MPQVHFKIDGEPVSCERDTMLLEVAREHGIDIPAPCHHDALFDYGACRLCLVEIEEDRWTGVDTACTYPVRERCVAVRTDTEEVKRYRNMNLQLLLARCPNSETVHELARSMGVGETEFESPDVKDNSSCILCGLCVNVCEELVGAGAIGFVGRGAERRVATPFDEPSGTCIGCGACAEVCPTGEISVSDAGRERTVEPFGTTLELVKCPECGKGYATEKQIEYMKEQLGERLEVLHGCPECSVRARAREFAGLNSK